MRAESLALAGLFAALLAAPPALAGHTGVPVPDGTVTFHILFVSVAGYLPAPTSHADALWNGTCAATAGMPVSCTYEPRRCLPNDLQLLCEL